MGTDGNVMGDSQLCASMRKKIAAYSEAADKQICLLVFDVAFKIKQANLILDYHDERVLS
jgi:hypothetical protein